MRPRPRRRSSTWSNWRCSSSAGRGERATPRRRPAECAHPGRGVGRPVSPEELIANHDPVVRRRVRDDLEPDRHGLRLLLTPTPTRWTDCAPRAGPDPLGDPLDAPVRLTGAAQHALRTRARRALRRAPPKGHGRSWCSRAAPTTTLGLPGPQRFDVAPIRRRHGASRSASDGGRTTAWERTWPEPRARSCSSDSWPVPTASSWISTGSDPTDSGTGTVHPARPRVAAVLWAERGPVAPVRGRTGPPRRRRRSMRTGLIGRCRLRLLGVEQTGGRRHLRHQGLAAPRLCAPVGVEPRARVAPAPLRPRRDPAGARSPRGSPDGRRASGAQRT